MPADSFHTRSLYSAILTAEDSPASVPRSELLAATDAAVPGNEKLQRTEDWIIGKLWTSSSVVDFVTVDVCAFAENTELDESSGQGREQPNHDEDAEQNPSENGNL